MPFLRSGLEDQKINASRRKDTGTNGRTSLITSDKNQRKPLPINTRDGGLALSDRGVLYAHTFRSAVVRPTDLISFCLGSTVVSVAEA